MIIPKPKGATGKLLISSPSMEGDLFDRTVILLLGHDEEGAIGVIVNRITQSISLKDLCDNLHLPFERMPKKKVHFGGPLSMNTGFVVHPKNYDHSSSVPITEGLGVTACVDVLKDFDQGKGPQESLFVLGHAGWGPGQLEGELKRGEWVLGDPPAHLLFEGLEDNLWEKAMHSTEAGLFSHHPISGVA